jgi:DNA-directed RNA polymerase specialized sigma24 family protein
VAKTAELVARASLGDQVAWDQLVERCGAMVWAVARGHRLGLNDAADVSQVTWLLLTQHLGLLPQPDRLGSWLVTTATREAVRMRRLRGGGVPSPPSMTWSDPSQGSAAECLPDVPDDPANTEAGTMPQDFSGRRSSCSPPLAYAVG